MAEIIVKMNDDRIKIKGGEYVADLVRCKECRYYLQGECIALHTMTKADDFCSYGEVRDE